GQVGNLPPIGNRRSSGMLINIDTDIQFLNPDAQWLSAPGECATDFLPAFSAISRAVQIALRECLPPAYFQHLEEFHDRQRANAILLFQATPPFRAKVRTDLTYDVLDPEMLEFLARRAKPGLTQSLTVVEAKLRAAGQIELASQYAPGCALDILASVRRLARSRRCLLGLIRGEGILVDALVQLGGARDLSARKQKARMASFCKKWNSQLRSICTGKDFSCLAPSILQAATQALASFLQK
ncbi:MAG TPA: hypothetical protein VIX89_04215, partial [Bryobacteraceae bacterium]